ncbi:metallophosphoesterase [Acetobacterium fimetarium]|uniref:Metallophosphoesterase n=1 Tax=Acetobacterium fimetarium TaxID=52691 RepID=A0ABR6WQP0_9FIRM|nr:metallophosphoesterase [Acetobacterium fimetarium]MBC3802923.1 metallophosphoesterase [Acetobacterium fimetarium]
MKLSKIFLITIFILGVLPLGLYVYARYLEPHRLIVNRVSLESSRIDGPLKIVFFGDTHMGKFNNTDQLSRIADKINAQNPDLVIFTGDLVSANKNLSVDTDAIAQVLQTIQAPYGKFCVIGNHEYATARQYSYRDLMHSAGFEVLVNDWLDIPEINVRLLGLDDAYAGKPDKILADDALDDAYNILITHEPDIIDSMDIDPVQLILAGHTHGGQISIPLLTERILPAGGKKYVKGLFAVGSDGQTALFVTKGTGMSTLPFRFLNVPEIVSIEIN